MARKRTVMKVGRRWWVVELVWVFWPTDPREIEPHWTDKDLYHWEVSKYETAHSSKEDALAELNQ
jgi:hypothetical protein